MEDSSDADDIYIIYSHDQDKSILQDINGNFTKIEETPLGELEEYSLPENIIHSIKDSLKSKELNEKNAAHKTRTADSTAIIEKIVAGSPNDVLVYVPQEIELVPESQRHTENTRSSPSDELKIHPVPEHWNGKIEYINLSNEQLEEERNETANQISFLSLEYKCHDCVIGFNFEYKYKSHMEMKHVQKEDCILCEICKCYITIRNEKKHLISHYGRWRCCHCNVMFKTKHAIVAHYNETHEKLEGNDFKCDQCDYEAKSYRTLLNHKRKHAPQGKLPVYECGKCCKSFLNKDSYRHHLEYFHITDRKIFECKICSKVFKIKQRLRIHNKEVHETDDSSYYCEVCHSVFKRMSTWRYHIAGHYNEYECDHCGLKFNRKYILKDHILSKHLKSNSLVCIICHKALSSKKSLKTHIRMVHQGFGKHKNKICDYCGKCFAKSSTLKGHINTHTGERPYNCKYCDANFGFKSALYTHTRLLHLGGKRQRDLHSVAE